MSRALTVLLFSLLVSLLVLLPLVILVGVAATFRIAGPIVGSQRFLEAIHRGDAPPDCRLRRLLRVSLQVAFLKATSLCLRDRSLTIPPSSSDALGITEDCTVALADACPPPALAV